VLLGYERFNFSPSELIPFILNQTKPQKQNKKKSLLSPNWNKIVAFYQKELWRIGCYGDATVKKYFFILKKKNRFSFYCLATC
jgi:hypothetical protein